MTNKTGKEKKNYARRQQHISIETSVLFIYLRLVCDSFFSSSFFRQCDDNNDGRNDCDDEQNETNIKKYNSTDTKNLHMCV